jgi:hypothetical protein
MKTKKNIPAYLILAFRAFLVLGIFTVATNCTPEEELVDPVATKLAPAEGITPESVTETASLTVSGAFIEYSDNTHCSECSYIVPPDASVVDGKELGIKPGDVICLKKDFSYKAIEFVNVEGKEENPVIVANCSE